MESDRVHSPAPPFIGIRTMFLFSLHPRKRTYRDDFSGWTIQPMHLSISQSTQLHKRKSILFLTVHRECGHGWTQHLEHAGRQAFNSKPGLCVSARSVLRGGYRIVSLDHYNHSIY